MSIAEPQVLLWTRTAYYTIAETGVFDEKRVELIEGEIIEMSPMTSKHGVIIHMVQNALRRVFLEGYFVAAQIPLDLGDISEPQPDVAVYAGSERDYLDHKPTQALLIVEVADSSLRFDRGKKASLYAKAGIQDYWIVNLRENTVEVYRTPAENDTQIYGYGYTLTLRLTTQDRLSPLASPASQLSVTDLLP